MNHDKSPIIFNGKTRAKLISDYDTRNLQSFAAMAIWVLSVILSIVLSIYGLKTLSFLPVATGFPIALLLGYMGNICPICDELKSSNYLYVYLFRFYKGSICRKCGLSNRQIDEVFNLLINGQPVSEETISALRKS